MSCAGAAHPKVRTKAIADRNVLCFMRSHSGIYASILLTCRLLTLNPPADRLVAPPEAYHELTWRVVQSTEPKTIVETVVQRFASGGCAVAGSVPTTRVISHDGKWTPPSPWA